LVVAWVLSGVAAMGATAGCAAERPPPVEDELAVTTAEFGVSDASADMPSVRCTPFARRACVTYRVRKSGIHDCIHSHQYCGVDGFTWHPCGDLAVDAGVDAGGASADDDDNAQP